MAAPATALAAELQQGASLLQAIAAAYAAGFRNIPADETVVLDAAQIAAMIDPAIAPEVMVLPIATALAAELQQGASLLQAIAAAYAAGFRNIPADETVVLDAAQIAAMIDPAIAPEVMVLPIAMALINWVIANNRSIGPDAGQTLVAGSISGSPSRR